jgi:hypothetical protein
MSASTVTRLLADNGHSDWRVKYDGSLSGNGAEVVSPVLTGENGLDAIRSVTRLLRDQGCTVNRTCGLHVHHDVRDLRIDDVKRVVRVWSANQSLIDGLVSPSRRGGSNTYCRHLNADDLRHIEDATDLRQVGGYVSRYKTLNLASYGRYGTVEIRQHQGTLDAEKIISWIRFGQGVIDGTVVSPAMETTFTTLRALFAAMGERLDETARTFLIGRGVEFGAVAV